MNVGTETNGPDQKKIDYDAESLQFGVDILYVSRKEEEVDSYNTQDSEDTSIRGHEDYVTESKETALSTWQTEQ